MSGFFGCVWDGVVTGFPFGLVLGATLALFRVSGVDFRQWFRDPAQPSEIGDDSWIGVTRDAAYLMALAVAIALAFAAVWHWFPFRRPPDFQGLLRFLAEYLGFWAQWHILFGVVIGLIVAQAIAEGFWHLGLSILPNPTRPARVLAQRPRVNPQPDPDRPRGARRLVICCDGTWNWPNPKRETNVVRLLRAIKPEAQSRSGEKIPQIIHYHLGVGTGNFVDRIVGGGAGIGLSNSVKACYGFLADNYVPGDEILLFGFSRGAYVARSLAGMVGVVGILRKPEMEHFYEMWGWYSDEDHRNPAVLEKIAPHRHQNVKVECVGVWDTVGALGIPGTRFCAKSFTFHETGLGEHVKHAFQALAIDEGRGNFQAAVWVPRRDARDQVLEQVWFPGVHSNIGGGYAEHGLSDTTLVWMLCQIDKWHLLEIDWACIAGSLDAWEPYPRGRLADSRKLAWRLVGCPVPRPVGITTESEKIHASAWDVRNATYEAPRRTAWLRVMESRKVAVTAEERRRYVTGPPRTEPRPDPFKLKLGWCDRLMEFIGGSG